MPKTAARSRAIRTIEANMMLVYSFGGRYALFGDELFEVAIIGNQSHAGLNLGGDQAVGIFNFGFRK